MDSQSDDPLQSLQISSQDGTMEQHPVIVEPNLNGTLEGTIGQTTFRGGESTLQTKRTLPLAIARQSTSQKSMTMGLTSMNTKGQHGARLSLGGNFKRQLPVKSLLHYNEQEQLVEERSDTLSSQSEMSEEDYYYEQEDRDSHGEYIPHRPRRLRRKKTIYTKQKIRELTQVYGKQVVQFEKPLEQSLGKYEIVKTLGSGGFGQVYLVKTRVKHKSHELLALKKIVLTTHGSSMTEQKRLRVMRETEIMEQIEHPHVVKMHAYFIDSDTNTVVNDDGEMVPQVGWYLCIVMEHAKGGDLLKLIDQHKQRGEPIEERKIWELCSQIAQGLNYLHQMQVVHRDIKPQNILITEQGTYKIGDLGISRSVHSRQQMLLESKIGTPLYAAPELVLKQPYDFKIDMWALGCVLHYMATLEHPFLNHVATKGKHVSRHDIEYQILNSTPKALPDSYSYRLKIVIKSLLEKDPSKRLSSQELLTFLPTPEEIVDMSPVVVVEEKQTPAQSNQQSPSRFKQRSPKKKESFEDDASPQNLVIQPQRQQQQNFQLQEVVINKEEVQKKELAVRIVSPRKSPRQSPVQIEIPSPQKELLFGNTIDQQTDSTQWSTLVPTSNPPLYEKVANKTDNTRKSKGKSIRDLIKEDQHNDEQMFQRKQSNSSLDNIQPFDKQSEVVISEKPHQIRPSPLKFGSIKEHMQRQQRKHLMLRSEQGQYRKFTSADNNEVIPYQHAASTKLSQIPPFTTQTKNYRHLMQVQRRVVSKDDSRGELDKLQKEGTHQNQHVTPIKQFETMEQSQQSNGRHARTPSDFISGVTSTFSNSINKNKRGGEDAPLIINETPPEINVLGPVKESKFKDIMKQSQLRQLVPRPPKQSYFFPPMIHSEQSRAAGLMSHTSKPDRLSFDKSVSVVDQQAHSHTSSKPNLIENSPIKRVILGTRGHNIADTLAQQKGLVFKHHQREINTESKAANKLSVHKLQPLQIPTNMSSLHGGPSRGNKSKGFKTTELSEEIEQRKNLNSMLLEFEKHHKSEFSVTESEIQQPIELDQSPDMKQIDNSPSGGVETALKVEPKIKKKPFMNHRTPQRPFQNTSLNTLHHIHQWPPSQLILQHPPLTQNSSQQKLTVITAQVKFQSQTPLPITGSDSIPSSPVLVLGYLQNTVSQASQYAIGSNMVTKGPTTLLNTNPNSTEESLHNTLNALIAHTEGSGERETSGFFNMRKALHGGGAKLSIHNQRKHNVTKDPSIESGGTSSAQRLPKFYGEAQEFQTPHQQHHHSHNNSGHQNYFQVGSSLFKKPAPQTQQKKSSRFTVKDLQ